MLHTLAKHLDNNTVSEERKQRATEYRELYVKSGLSYMYLPDPLVDLADEDGWQHLTKYLALTMF